MKLKIKWAIFFAMIIVALSADTFSDDPAMSNPKQYSNGDTLYPDYVHTDTLIVTDADLLNHLIKVDTLNTDGSNSDILCLTTEAIGHECRWKLCPYKGITMDHRGDAVRKYTGIDEGDAFSIDMLHLEFPDKDYDALDSMLFTSIK